MELKEKFLKIVTETGKELNLCDFMKHLDSEEILLLIEMIMTNKYDDFIRLFYPVKNIDSEDIALSSIYKLPYNLLIKISDNYDVIFQRAIENMYEENSYSVMKKLIALSDKDNGLSNGYIEKKINDLNLHASLKISLLFLLYSRNKISLLNKYLENEIFVNEPNILPFIIKFLCKKDDKNIKYYLKKYVELNPSKPDDETMKWFNEVFYDIFLERIKENNFVQLGEIYKIIREVPWINYIIANFLSFKEFNKLPNFLQDFHIIEKILLSPNKNVNIEKEIKDSLVDLSIFNNSCEIYISSINSYASLLTTSEITNKIEYRLNN